jgi:hypothetical protein
MAGHSHRHIGDIEDLYYVDQENGFIIVYNYAYSRGIVHGKGRSVELKSYSRITIDISLENGKTSNRHTAVYHKKHEPGNKLITRYRFTKNVGSSMNIDLSPVPKDLYVIQNDCIIWEGIPVLATQ